MKVALPIRPPVFCDLCDLALEYQSEGGKLILYHGYVLGCLRTFQKFEPPTFKVKLKVIGA